MRERVRPRVGLPALDVVLELTQPFPAVRVRVSLIAVTPSAAQRTQPEDTPAGDTRRASNRVRWVGFLKAEIIAVVCEDEWTCFCSEICV